MRLAFVNPPLIGRRQKAVEAEDCCWGVGSRVLPAMLLACTSEARRVGHDVAFIDLTIDKPTVLAAFKPDAVIHALPWQWWKQVNAAMSAVCQDTQRVILAVPPGYAGHYATGTGCPVVFSEPERIMAMPTNAWAQDEKLPNCLADLGPVDYTLVPSHYWQRYKAAVYQATRGCCYHCSFCVWGGSTVTDTTFRLRPAAQVASNLRQLRELSTAARGKPLPLYLLAAQLTSSDVWIREFHAEMAGEPYQFQSNVNLGDLTAEKMRLLMECGLSSTSVGLEAGATPLLYKLGKPYTFERALHGLLTLQEVGIKWRAHVRYGFGETAEDVEESAENVHRMRHAGLKRLRVDFAPIVHYEGTRILAEANYELKPLPKRAVECLVMAEPPDWTPFTDALRQYDWLTSEGARK